MKNKWTKKYTIVASGNTEASKQTFEDNLRAILQNHRYIFKGTAEIVEKKK